MEQDYEEERQSLLDSGFIVNFTLWNSTEVKHDNREGGQKEHVL